MVVPVEESYDVEPVDAPECSITRFGHGGGWGFCAECPGWAGGYDQILARLSTGTETMTLTCIGDSDCTIWLAPPPRDSQSPG